MLNGAAVMQESKHEATWHLEEGNGDRFGLLRPEAKTMTPNWRVPLTQPAWLVTFCVPNPAEDGQAAYASEWFDSEGEARAQIMRLVATYRRLTYSLRRFEPGESRAGDGTVVEESAQ